MSTETGSPNTTFHQHAIDWSHRDNYVVDDYDIAFIELQQALSAAGAYTAKAKGHTFYQNGSYERLLGAAINSVERAHTVLLGLQATAKAVAEKEEQYREEKVAEARTAHAELERREGE